MDKYLASVLAPNGYSTFHRLVDKGYYTADWAGSRDADTLAKKWVESPNDV